MFILEYFEFSTNPQIVSEWIQIEEYDDLEDAFYGKIECERHDEAAGESYRYRIRELRTIWEEQE